MKRSSRSVTLIAAAAAAAACCSCGGPSLFRPCSAFIHHQSATRAPWGTSGKKRGGEGWDRRRRGCGAGEVAMSASSSAAAGGAGGLSTIGTEGSTLLHHTDFMASCKVVLASQSPRRKEIFDLMGLSPIVEVSGFEEDLDKSSFAHPGDYAATNAEYKAREVAEKLLLAGGYSSPTVVVGSDTIVDLDGKILEKPQDDEEAFRMLSSLSGRQHLVHSGVAIFTSQGGCTEPALRFYETTSVLFAPLSETEIRAYIATREPFDKSGAYGIQGWGGQFVQKIDGCYFNVMGFPMHKFSGALAGLIRESKV